MSNGISSIPSRGDKNVFWGFLGGKVHFMSDNKYFWLVELTILAPVTVFIKQLQAVLEWQSSVNERLSAAQSSALNPSIPAAAPLRTEISIPESGFHSPGERQAALDTSRSSSVTAGSPETVTAAGDSQDGSLLEQYLSSVQRLEEEEEEERAGDHRGTPQDLSDLPPQGKQELLSWPGALQDITCSVRLMWPAALVDRALAFLGNHHLTSVDMSTRSFWSPNHINVVSGQTLWLNRVVCLTQQWLYMTGRCCLSNGVRTFTLLEYQYTALRVVDVLYIPRSFSALTSRLVSLLKSLEL